MAPAEARAPDPRPQTSPKALAPAKAPAPAHPQERINEDFIARALEVPGTTPASPALAQQHPTGFDIDDVQARLRDVHRGETAAARDDDARLAARQQMRIGVGGNGENGCAGRAVISWCRTAL